uniref:U7-Hexatoxin-Hc1a_1 n=1 Tax=Hadronyche cerberea TaxID=1107879 RepID=A0A4Q8KA86_HADCE
MTSTKLVAVALLISCLVYITVGQQYGIPLSCGEREVFNQCGPNCPKTCSNLLQLRPLPMCLTKICRPGCTCDKQYVRNGEGKCVFPSECGFNKN